MKEQAVYGITHITMVLSTAAGATQVPTAPNLLKSDITIATTTSGTSLGTVMIAGGATYPAGLTTGAGMVEASNLAGLAYTINGPAPFYVGVLGLTTTVQIIQSLSNIGGATFR